MTCEEEYQEFIDAGEEFSRIENALSSIFPPTTTPISHTKDVTPTVLTQEMLDKWRELDGKRKPARDKWMEKAQAYLDCIRSSNE